jgi:very-short-patch-repair endonuclease
VRKGRYIEPPADERAIDAARLGGRLDCVSLLGAFGVFVQDRHGLHIAVEPGASRLPTGAARHWRHTTSDARLEIIEALAQACRCQSVPAAIATLDSAWHLRLVDSAAIDEVFARLPKRYRILRRRLDPRCESGPESLVRLMLWRLGVGYSLQERIRGVGRVDFVVAGRLIVECDSRAFHSDWAQRREDYRRDLAAAAQGFVVLRIVAEDILFRPDDVFLALHGAVSALGMKRGARNSSSMPSQRR